MLKNEIPMWRQTKNQLKTKWGQHISDVLNFSALESAHNKIVTNICKDGSLF